MAIKLTELKNFCFQEKYRIIISIKINWSHLRAEIKRYLKLVPLQIKYSKPCFAKNL